MAVQTCGLVFVSLPMLLESSVDKYILAEARFCPPGILLDGGPIALEFRCRAVRTTSWGNLSGMYVCVFLCLVGIVVTFEP